MRGERRLEQTRAEGKEQKNDGRSFATRNSAIKRHEGGVFFFFGTANLFCTVGTRGVLSLTLFTQPEHLHTGNKDNQGNVSCKSLSNANGGLDKRKAGQVIQRLWAAGIVNSVSVCVCSLQLTKGVDSSRMEMGVKLAHLQSKPRHKLRT